MPSALETLRSQVMSTRAVMINSLNDVATQRDAAINQIRTSLSQQGEGEMGILPRIQSIRNNFLAPTGQEAGGTQQQGILSRVLSGKGVLGVLSTEGNGNGQQQTGGILGMLQKRRQQLLNPSEQPPTSGLAGYPKSSFLNAPPERKSTGMDTQTPMGAIPVDASVNLLVGKGIAPTSLGNIEVD